MISDSKKGFSLVELLLVMVILAILALLVYPTILDLYKNSQKNFFLTESKNIYGLATDKYRAEIMNNKKITRISSDEGSESLKNFSDKYKYCVDLDREGYVSKIMVTDGVYYVEGGKDFENSGTREDIKYGTFTEFSCDYVLKDEDLLVEKSVKDIRADADYKNALKYLLIAFGVTVVLSLIFGRKSGR